MAKRLWSGRNMFAAVGGVTLMFALALAVWGIAKAAEPTAKPLTVAVVDTQKVFDGYTKTKAANKTLETAVKRLEDQGKAMNDEIAKLEENLSKQRLFVDEPQRIQQWEREIAQKRNELRQFVTTGDDALREKQDELSKPILDEIRTAIQDWGKAHGYSLVLEKQLIALYHEPDMDITDALLADLNERASKAAASDTASGAPGSSTAPKTP